MSKPTYNVIDINANLLKAFVHEGITSKVEAKALRNQLNDEHNGWPVDKEGKRIPDAMPRFVVSKV